MSSKFKKNKKQSSNDRVRIEKTAVRAKKHLGQHFLKDENIAKKIGDTLTLNGYTNVIEIGPGMGVLTKYILQKDVDLIAMDLDTESIDYLNTSFPLEHPEIRNGKGAFKVIEADFLKYDLDTLFDNDPFAITGNFPYNISSQIVFKTLEKRKRIPEFTGMFQKEVAQRICEKPGSKAYGILSVLTQAFYNAEYLFTVPPSVFNPPPKVDSGVLRLIRKSNHTLPCDEKLFYKVVKTSFGQRRKTLRNSLKTFQLPDEIKEMEILTKRPEQLSVDQFIELTLLIEKSRI
ncbi:16S rRNA (adenine(1518)-N(6)/adenine(1519)-N(6))-dimethyltransferase RsmA [Aquimarina sp. AD1]|uniref:16S rRNA (adenine(1518)-N(6)/adenine(1519)-N(6))- dimethyltransferase RsmA n=1 Tax=Aquimarina sp. (strain AD1) TaxID=1714848 RepID=UPI000E468238|nr:16S rRNA (adenine(1518)-N(6)/adenine(1519)-N(6))-dimethyltransferase RsmA [Aquimarina sp. AD1]AXT57637.1 16S rRNA (adenine(1518)-N(6)/adenine(1519)-N(6))-dimethyltransferase RsmA [Aquimarina sp. AD1]RKN29031.1 16S rRNA (adenine(1518)-N(6)/adenine(1519)-N(6))-dimethyltransferase RsmA [Aquimarina sp. AD1]